VPQGVDIMSEVIALYGLLAKKKIENNFPEKIAFTEIW